MGHVFKSGDRDPDRDDGSTLDCKTYRYCEDETKDIIWVGNRYRETKILYTSKKPEGSDGPWHIGKPFPKSAMYTQPTEEWASTNGIAVMVKPFRRVKTAYYTARTSRKPSWIE